jgi:hypothetical protein
MKRTYEMIEKGWEYRTAGYTLRKGYDRKAVTHCGFSTLDRYADVQHWSVYPDDEQVVYQFHTLAQAKAFITKRDAERSAR